MIKASCLIILLFSMFLSAWADTDSEPQYRQAELRNGYGYIDRNGHFVIPPRFESANPFSEGVAAATRFLVPSDFEEKHTNFMDRTGFITKTGAYSIPPIYRRGQAPFRNGKTVVSDRMQDSKLIDKSGHTIASFKKGSDDEVLLDSGHVLLKRWIYEGLADSEGNVLLEPKCDKIFPFFQGFAVVHVNGKLTPVELQQGNVVACGQPGILQSKAELIDRFGKIVIPPNFDELRPLSATSVFF